MLFASGLKLASGKKLYNDEDRDGDFYAKALAASKENACLYDELASEATIYGYVGGNSVNRVDPWGLAGIGHNGGPPLEDIAVNTTARLLSSTAIGLVLFFQSTSLNVGEEQALQQLTAQHQNNQTSGQCTQRGPTVGGLGGRILYQTNRAGGGVVTFPGYMSQSDIGNFIDYTYYTGDLNILSGVHGTMSGKIIPELSFYKADLEDFGYLPGVTVYNLPSMTASEIRSLLNGPNTTMGAFCHSAFCLPPYK